MATYQISETDMASVKYERFHYPIPKIMIRYHVLYFKGLGYNNKDIAILCSIHRNTVRCFLDLYRHQGIEGLKQLHYKTPSSELDECKKTLENSFRDQPPHTVREARCRIIKLTGIDRSISRVRAFMKRIGMRPLKTGHVPAKANVEEQQRFVEQSLQPLIDQADAGKCHLLYMDGVHFVLSAFVAMVWCFERVFIKSASGRFRINLLAVLHSKTKEITSVYNDSYLNALTVIELFKEIKRRYRKLPIYIVLDNARYQKCKIVQQAAMQLGIHLVYLPPYSPNLNIIERLWKLVKKEVCNAKYYPDASSFEKAILDYIESLYSKAARKMLKKRLSNNFHLFPNAQKLTA